MTDEPPIGDLPEEAIPAEPVEHAPAARPRRDPAATLNLAMLVYILITALFAFPLLVFPAQFYDIVGVDGLVASQLGGLRWVGAMLAAWAVSAILVLARPVGRAIFVTTGALQMTFGALAFVYVWVTDDILGSTAFHAIATILLAATAGYLWWARLVARRVLAGSPPPPGT